MKAVICTKYGPPEVLQLREVEKPVPNDREVLIKIIATTVTASDCLLRGFVFSGHSVERLMMGLVLGFGKPRNPIIGNVFSGQVVSAGRAVTRFQPGESVFAFSMLRFGAYAEYVCMPENGVMAQKPVNLTCAQAAAVPYGGMLALHYLKKGQVTNGQKVLIYGASGAIGTFAVQLARHFGAQVTGVCSTANLELVKSLGAERVIDYTRQDFTAGGERYDLILNAVGKSKAQLHCKQALSPTGKHITVDDGGPEFSTQALVSLKELIEAGTLHPVIDRTYPLEQIVEAHRYVDLGHKKGNVVISVGQEASIA